MKKTIIRAGKVIDPANGINGICDVCFEDEKIIAVDTRINTKTPANEINAEGKLVFPGLVDTHVHISSEPVGFMMLAKAGVTTALDLQGIPDEILKSAQGAATGLTIAFLYGLVPGKTVSSENPSAEEIENISERVLAEGALGLKILGGHYPMTPEAINKAIKTTEKLNCYCAVHAGSTENGSNISGLKELMSLRENIHIHIAHINSYCRGQIKESPEAEAAEALKLLNEAENLKSESYLSQINGTSARINNGVPLSHVTRTCLRARNYSENAEGLEKAILDGWAQVNGRNNNNEVILLPTEEGLKLFRERKSSVHVSFAVNSPAVLSLLAGSRKPDGSFSVDAISTDGGIIPRNTALANGLSLVEKGILTLEDFVIKSSLNPANMLGLKYKGRLSSGADADIIIADPYSKTPEIVICRGTKIIENGQRTAKKECIFATTKDGLKYYRKHNTECLEINPKL